MNLFYNANKNQCIQCRIKNLGRKFFFVESFFDFYNRNLYQTKNTKNKTKVPAPMAIQEVAFKSAASFLYLSEWNFRFWALESSSAKINVKKINKLN